MTFAALDRHTASSCPERPSLLYVEPHPADVALMAHYVDELDGVAFTAVSSVEEAITLARAAPPTAMLIDLDLVTAGVGIDTLARLRTLPELRTVLLVGLSGRAHPRGRALARHLGFHRFVAKPISLGELGRALASALPMAAE